MNEKPRCEINVTPLVDVCLVMLIIFMVVTPMIVERVELPRTAQPEERKPKRSEQVRLVVGYPRGELWLEDDMVEESLLVEKLKDIKERAPSKQLVLLADARLDVADVKRAMRASDRAGFHEFGCVVQKAVQKPAQKAAER
jgi:biopolymer transport protein ExbD